MKVVRKGAQVEQNEKDIESSREWKTIREKTWKMNVGHFSFKQLIFIYFNLFLMS